MNNPYLSVNTPNEDAVNLIKNSILNLKPFAFTRYGDGEIYSLNRNLPENVKKRACLNWGYIYPQEIDLFYSDVEKILIDSFVGSDLIGLMDKNCDIVKINYSPRIWSIEKSKVLSWGVNPNELNICDHQLSRQKLFGSVDGMKNILQGNSVHIISRNTNLLQQKNLNKLLDCEVTFTHHPQEINFNNRESFLKDFEKIKSNVVLLGVGLQKDYTTILKIKHNKIALDMGATMDAWAGIYTRPWFKEGGLQEHLIIK